MSVYFYRNPEPRFPWARVFLTLLATGMVVALSWRDHWGSCGTIGVWLLLVLLFWSSYETRPAQPRKRRRPDDADGQ